MATFKKNGYGQVEPNHLSAQRTGQIYAQLPAEKTIDVLENGQFVKYDVQKGVVDFTGEGEWMMIFNEIKLYDEVWRETYKDFAMKKADYVSEDMVPRVFKTNVGDIYTTNNIADGDYEVGDKLVPNASGVLAVNNSPAATDMVWQIGKIYTLADLEPAVKLQRIQ